MMPFAGRNAAAPADAGRMCVGPARPRILPDRRALRQDQDVVDHLALDLHAGQIADDDARPAIRGGLKAAFCRAFNPPINRTSIVNGGSSRRGTGRAASPRVLDMSRTSPPLLHSMRMGGTVRA